MSSNDVKLKIIEAAKRAVEELINVAKEKIVTGTEDDVSADRLKNAAATKKLAIFDAFEILSRIEQEQEVINFESKGLTKTNTNQGFAERRSK
jgi:hypothetical protein